MPSSDPVRRFQDIVENVDRIESYLEGYDFAQFTQDLRTIDAVELLPEQDWDAMRGFGNVLRHDYDRIAEALIWKIATVDLPRLRADCRRAIGMLEAGR